MEQESNPMPRKKITKSPLKRFLTRLRAASFHTKTLLFIGVLFILIPFFFYLNEGIQLAFFTPTVPVVQKILPAPTWVSIPAVQMELPIFETAIHSGVWGIADNGISHLTISARPGETGPIILYGHNTNDRFGPIRWLKIGDKIALTAGTNKPYTYVVEKVVEVSPSDVSILLSQKGQTLILYTCDGFADLQRFVVIAKPS